MIAPFTILFLLGSSIQSISAFPQGMNTYFSQHVTSSKRPSILKMASKVNNEIASSSSLSRRSFIESMVLSTTAATAFLSVPAPFAFAADSKTSSDDEKDEMTVQTPLYFILRVKEATEQETRLIKSGKFKDVQRANVKLAVKFMLDNYRLNDNFIAASAFLNGDKKIKAVNIGQNTVQNLVTILEYFDTSDVENIKVGSSGLAGKETIVLNGLAAANKAIDDFVSLFPQEDIAAVVARIDKENELNKTEFDPNLGTILNLKPVQ